MRTPSADLKINKVPVYEAPQRVEKGIFTLPIIILLLCMVPDTLGADYAKVPTAVFLLFATLPAVLAAFARKIKVAGRGVFLTFLLITVLNIFIGLAYGAPILRWMRMAFCSYIFVAMFFYVALNINTPARRDHLWKLLIIFISIASFLDFITVVRYGLAETFEGRAAGGHAFTVTALMLLLPVLGTVLSKKKWLLIFFVANLFLLFLSGSRGTYLIILMGILYTFIFIQKRFAYRLAFLLFILIVGAVLVNTPVYNRMAERFSTVTEGGDVSTLRRLDEAKSAVAAVRQGWASLLLGKGFGIIWKAQFNLSGGWITELPGGYMSDAPHNDYASRLLYCGLLGLTVQLLVYFIIGINCFAALRRARVIDVNVNAIVRLHGALLVLISMMMAGFAGGVFIFFNNNVYQAFIFGMAMSDATEILSRKGNNASEDNNRIVAKSVT